MSETAENQPRSWAIEAAPIRVVTTDATAEGNPITYIDQRFSDLTGYAESEAVGRNCRFLQGPDTEEEPVSEHRAAVEESRSSS